MKFSSQSRPISDLETHAAEIVRDITHSRQPLLMTENGEAKLVVMDLRSYEEQQEAIALLKILATGNREIEKGKFRSAEDVFAELDEEDSQ